MSLTYPRALIPEFIVPRARFWLDRVQSIARSRGGSVQATESGRTLWMAEFSTADLSTDQHEEVQAFLDSLRGHLNNFLLASFARARPRNYPGSGWSGFTRHGGGAFDGTATVLDTSAAYTVNLSTLPDGFVLKAGDMLSWAWRSSRTLHRVVEGGTSASGLLTVQVEPDIPSGGTLPATVKLEAADAVFKLFDPNWESWRQPAYGEPVTVKAVQVLA